MACSSDPEENLAKAIWKIRELAGRGARIICLQELFRYPYFPREQDPRFFKLAESPEGAVIGTFRRLAQETSTVLIVPVFERRAPGIYHNSAAVIDSDGSLLGFYRKAHIPDDPCFYEKFYFTPGDESFPVFQTKYGTIAVLICWDQWFPEAARIAALRGAFILFYPTAIGWLPGEENQRHSLKEAWTLIQRAHALANGLFVVSVNRVGTEGAGNDAIHFWGSSFVADPFGRIIACASEEHEETLLATCDLQLIETTRQTWPFLRDRRPDLYGPITRRWLEQE